MNPEKLDLEINNKIILIWQSILFSNKHYESFSINKEPNDIPPFENNIKNNSSER